MKNISILIFIVILPFISLYSQNPGWIHYSHSGAISSIAEEGNHLWIGTRGGGLVRLDKTTDEKQFFNTSNSGVNDYSIKCVNVDNSGIKWIGTSNSGFVKFDNNYWELIDNTGGWWPYSGFSSTAITSDGTVWIAGNFGLFKYDGVNFTHYGPQNSLLPSYYVSKVIADDNDVLWIATSEGMATFDGTNWNIFNPYNSGLPSISITDIAIDSNGDKWIATGNAGFVKYVDSSSTWTHYSLDQAPLSNQLPINSLALDHDSIIWLGTNEGMLKFNFSSFGLYNTANSLLPNNKINMILVDADNIKWIGTDKGLMKYDMGTFTLVPVSNSGLPSNSTGFVHIAADGKKWIGHTEGITIFDDTGWVNINSSNSPFSGTIVRAIKQAPDSSHWIGTTDGLLHYDGALWSKHTTQNSGLPHDGINDIIILPNGTLWIGTDGGGLTSYDGTTWSVYNTMNSGLPHNKVNNVAAGPDGTIWAGTPTGLACLNGNTWTHHHKFNSGLPDSEIIRIAIENSGNIWLSTAFDLVKFDGTNWSVYNQLNSGVPHLHISALMIDKYNNKWLGTGSGVAKYDDANDIWTYYQPWLSRVLDKGGQVTSIAIDDNGNKWYTTASAGLIVINENGVIFSVDELPNAKTSLRVFPNPSSGKIYVSGLPNTASITHAEIFTAAGARVAAASDMQHGADISGLAPGLYFLRVHHDRGVSVVKFVRE